MASRKISERNIKLRIERERSLMLMQRQCLRSSLCKLSSRRHVSRSLDAYHSGLLSKCMKALLLYYLKLLYLALSVSILVLMDVGIPLLCHAPTCTTPRTYTDTYTQPRARSSQHHRFISTAPPTSTSLQLPGIESSTRLPVHVPAQLSFCAPPSPPSHIIPADAALAGDSLHLAQKPDN